MERKQDGLVPIGEAFGGLGGPVKAIRDASPQALHHFTQVDQVNQLAAAREADADLGFMARMMALCSLPRTNPGNRLQYKRQNGPYTLYMTATAGSKLPFGTLPRLLLAWVSTDAVKTQSPVLVLGKSLAEFMGKLDLHMSGGSNRGDRTRLRNQMDRLFNSTVSLVYEDRGPDNSTHVKDTFTSPVARKTHLVWKSPTSRRADTVGEHHRVRPGLLQRDHPPPGAARHEHPQGHEALSAGPRFLSVAHLSDLHAESPAAALLAVPLPAVRGRSIESERPGDGR